MKKITVSLNHESINKAIKELKNYQREIDRKRTLLVERLAEEGYKTIEFQLKDIHYSGALQSSIFNTGATTEGKQTRAIIGVDNEHAIYVEFGTGVVGEGTYTGELPIPYRYNVGATIGWYNVGGVMRYGWYYRDYEGILHFTEGMVARPFMLDSSQELRFIILDKIVKEIFND